MIKINQALFGYTNGHHLLKASQALSNSSLKILEPLSDFSGSNWQHGFEEYIIGCPLPDDKCYALSKTWYAFEMKRPGCVWTHTLLIDYSTLESLREFWPIDILFVKPDALNNLSIDTYAEQICVDTKALSLSDNNNLYEFERVASNQENIIKILFSFFESERPILIAAEEAKEYNEILEFLVVKLSKYFFNNISFCTGSLSNRTINKKTLDIQIVPASISKNIFRNVTNAQVVTDSKKDTTIPQWVELIFQEFVLQKNVGLENFILSFGEKYCRRDSLKSFAKAYIIAAYDNSFDIIHYLHTISEGFTSDQQSFIVDKAFLLLFSENQNISFPQIYSSAILEQLSTFKDDNGLTKDITEATLYSVLKSIWLLHSDDLRQVFQTIITRDINSFGERIIIALASRLLPEQLPELTGTDCRGSSLLIRFNWKLALCDKLWRQPLNFQIETLNCLRSLHLDTSENTTATIRKLILTILENSSENLTDQIYHVFGPTTVQVLLTWGESVDKKSRLDQWAKLYGYNTAITIDWLSHINNPLLLQAILNILDPYDNSTLITDKNIWISLYHKFHLPSGDQEFNDAFAQFILPLILQSNSRYPADIAQFAFCRVYSIFVKDKMSYASWERLSRLLPEVAWYNSWDKCKRLRKACKKLKYDFEFIGF